MFVVNAKHSYPQYPYTNNNLSFHGFIYIEHLKKIDSKLSLARLERKENCDTSHYWNRVAIIESVTIIAWVSLRNKLWKCKGVKLLSLSFFLSFVVFAFI